MRANFLLLVSLTILCVSGVCQGWFLRKNFYQHCCPKAEETIKSVIWKRVAADSGLPAELLRMHFHDCFVRGCDGSVLLDSPNNTAEKDSAPNLTLEGFDVIDEAKTAVEKICPGIVSCADILALAARDSVSFQVHIPLGMDTAICSATDSITSEGKEMQTLHWIQLMQPS
uniref:Plant heme peroxidase family profile domain-containing protein n=1 Tax=Nelumbo nucifera TaxID=4432 RepID=A0A822YUZ7_NELNU|nr:TPA_asm: hypothetical protein HUJ06_008535 [Nelumbo nucifera]